MRRLLVLLTAVLGVAAWTIAPAGATTGAGIGAAAPPSAAAVQLVGGEYLVLASGARCVIGFNARDRAGARFIVTAGACGGVAGGVIGAPSGSVSTPYVRSGSGLLTISGAGTATVGLAVCMFGPVGGFRCGSVTALNQTVNFGGQIVTGLIRTNICAQPGEAGSPLYQVSTRRAIGVLVGGSGSCSSGGVSFFRPINAILAAHGLTLYTG